MYGELTPCGGGRPTPLTKRRIVVGRGADCDVRLPHRTVSSQHCLLELRERVWFVTDLGSHNGIRIDGVRCHDGRLDPGRILWIAQHRFQLEYEIKENIGLGIVPLRRAASTRVGAGPAEPPPRASSPEAVPLSRMPNGASLGELIPCGGGDVIPLRKTSLTVGRSSDCDIVLAFSVVSSQHCRLEFREGFWHVRDLGSRNGIRVDGVFEQSKYLRPHDVLSIARLRFEIVYTALGDRPPDDEDPFRLSLLEKAGLTRPGPAHARREPQQGIVEDAPRRRWVIDENDPT